jgi:hypothetical protein
VGVGDAVGAGVGDAVGAGVGEGVAAGGMEVVGDDWDEAGCAGEALGGELARATGEWLTGWPAATEQAASARPVAMETRMEIGRFIGPDS